MERENTPPRDDPEREHHDDRDREDHSGMQTQMYLRFGAMILTGMVVMYGVMFFGSWEWSHVRWSQSRMFMALTMGGTMGLVMLAWMLNMYRNTMANLIVVGVSLTLLTVGIVLDRSPVSWATDLEHLATARLQDAALDAATALLEAGRLDEAEHAVRQGLKLCDPCEPLYVVWAQIEHARGRADRIGQLWSRLRQRYADDADDTFSIPVTPTADTEEVFATLASQRDEAS